MLADLFPSTPVAKIIFAQTVTEMGHVTNIFRSHMHAKLKCQSQLLLFQLSAASAALGGAHCSYFGQRKTKYTLKSSCVLSGLQHSDLWDSSLLLSIKVNGRIKHHRFIQREFFTYVDIKKASGQNVKATEGNKREKIREQLLVK